VAPDAVPLGADAIEPPSSCRLRPAGALLQADDVPGISIGKAQKPCSRATGRSSSALRSCGQGEAWSPAAAVRLELFEHELKDINAAEHSLLDALEQMAGESADREIKKALHAASETDAGPDQGNRERLTLDRRVSG